MKLITMTLIILATLVIAAKEKDSECIKELNKCRTPVMLKELNPMVSVFSNVTGMLTNADDNIF